jgi:1-aminocyclopropane-1-carboxylate deaminase/D-cysteine desulfhydrase-like pyridoxal-dependent ACC family enzyme
MRLASLPTPVREVAVQLDSGERKLSVKYDDQTGVIYGGNKVRKLEYIFPRARDKKCGRLATFGAVGSNSALATALYARQAGFDCTCFLMHQAKTEQIPATLNMHIQNGTELVRYGGAYNKRVQTLRDNLWGRHAWVIPMGGRRASSLPSKLRQERFRDRTGSTSGPVRWGQQSAWHSVLQLRSSTLKCMQCVHL